MIKSAPWIHRSGFRLKNVESWICVGLSFLYFCKIESIDRRFALIDRVVKSCSLNG